MAFAATAGGAIAVLEKMSLCRAVLDVAASSCTNTAQLQPSLLLSILLDETQNAYSTQRMVVTVLVGDGQDSGRFSCTRQSGSLKTYVSVAIKLKLSQT